GKARVQSQIVSLLESDGHLRAVDDVKLDRRALKRIEIVAVNPERRDAEQVDLVAAEKELRTSAMSDGQIKDALMAVKQRRELPKDRLYIYYLDPQLHYAVRRREERYQNGKLLVQINNDDFKKLKDRELWLPQTTVVDQ